MKNLFKILGIDHSIFYSISARLLSAGGNIVVLTLIMLFITKEEQGYYYTFGSLVAMQVFFELGLNGIITQYVAHEYVNIHFDENFNLIGDERSISRLSSILHFCFKIFFKLSIIFFLVVFIFGFLFFKKYNNSLSNLNWAYPWCLLVFATSLMLFLNPFCSFIEGLGEVRGISKLRFFQQIFTLLTTTFVLLLKGNLYALGISMLVSCMVVIFYVYFTYKNQLVSIYKAIANFKINYWDEIFPYQWKIALSWISGYFIFQLFNPVLFATDGPIIAGQMGMTIQALNGISSLSMSWITTKIPIFSTYVAKRNFIELDITFNKTLKQLSIVNLFLLTFFITLIYILNHFNIEFGNRFLPLTAILLLSFVTFLNQFVFSWAAYLRCHKQEPYLVPTIITSLLIISSTLFLGNKFGLYGIIFGYTFIALVIGVPWCYFIFRSKRKIWHNI